MPSIRKLMAASESQTVSVIALAIYNIVGFYNVGNSMTPIQVQQTASLISERYDHLKMGDIEMFSKMAMCGDFGTSFNRMDGVLIMEWIKKFDVLRTEQISHVRIMESQERKEDSKQAITGLIQQPTSKETIKKIHDLLDGTSAKEHRAYNPSKGDYVPITAEAKAKADYDRKLYEFDNKMMRDFDKRYKANPIYFHNEETGIPEESPIRMVKSGKKYYDLTGFLQRKHRQYAEFLYKLENLDRYYQRIAAEYHSRNKRNAYYSKLKQ